MLATATKNYDDGSFDVQWRWWGPGQCWGLRRWPPLPRRGWSLSSTTPWSWSRYTQDNEEEKLSLLCLTELGTLSMMSTANTLGICCAFISICQQRYNHIIETRKTLAMVRSEIAAVRSAISNHSNPDHEDRTWRQTHPKCWLEKKWGLVDETFWVWFRHSCTTWSEPQLGSVRLCTFPKETLCALQSKLAH